MNVYVVFGRTGEYSDSSEWPVCWFKDGPTAELFAVRANRWAKSFEAQTERYGRVPSRGLCPFDPDFSMDYTGTDYTVAEIHERLDVPEESEYVKP